jgi:hypothetical protein
MAKRSAANTPLITDREAYKGYYLLYNPFVSTWYISKDGQHISSAGNRPEAHMIVDELTA